MAINPVFLWEEEVDIPISDFEQMVMHFWTDFTIIATSEKSFLCFYDECDFNPCKKKKRFVKQMYEPSFRFRKFSGGDNGQFYSILS